MVTTTFTKRLKQIMLQSQVWVVWVELRVFIQLLPLSARMESLSLARLTMFHLHLTPDERDTSYVKPTQPLNSGQHARPDSGPALSRHALYLMTDVEIKRILIAK